MIQFFSDFFSFSFLLRALIGGALVALSASLLGTSLVLTRYAMIGDGLSHVAFGALAIAMALSAAPLLIAIPVVMLAAFLLLRLSDNNRVRGDSAIAMLSSASMAVGVIVISLVSGMNTDLYSFMFGSILSMSQSDMVMAILLSVVVTMLFSFSYNNLFAVTFDENFARASGVRAGIWNALLAMLASVTIVLGMRIMGAILISSLIIFPPLSAMRLCGSFKGVTLLSALSSIVCFVVGLFLSYALDLPSGPVIVLTNVACFLLFSSIRLVRGRKRFC
ncbi:MAG: metal ABC transporter permease [Clostridiales bacterium]|jgi:zinc transport system permease protein|nr:metal ABC transporter permease [Clostridiales bacterium]MDD3540685.1 metal ABC transporter permease [Eubacteriales bacterium]MDY0119461.1 metal ABC transporter permease [Clostridia bacterium]NLG29931.1 metal ABC transporter permease [Clostridiaceae bacterium]MCK9350101.1 metal ABC transporter permease [Clostridiales bacterium]